MQHRGAQPLRDDAAPAVFLKRNDSKADHVRAAAGERRAAGEPRKAQRRADGRRGYRQRQRDADDDRNEHAHDKRLLSCRPFYERSDRHRALADGSCDEVGNAHAYKYRDNRGHENVDLRLLRDHFAELGRDYRNNVNGKRTARAAHDIRRVADGDERKQHHRRGVQRVAYRHRHCRADHRRGEFAYRVARAADLDELSREKRYTQLRAESVEYRADEQGAEQSLRHRAERVYAVALEADLDILALEKCLYLGHK